MRIFLINFVIISVFALIIVQATPAKADLNNALKAVSKKQWDTAYQQAANIRSPLERDIFNWYAFAQKDSRASFSTMNDFLMRRNDWPSQNKIKVLAEKKMSSATPPSQIIEFFKKSNPVSAECGHAYATAL